MPITSAKPLSPVQVSITPVETAQQGSVVEFIVRASVTVDVENVQITVSVPSTLNVLSGELNWLGPLSKSQEKQLRFTASLRDTPANTVDEFVIQVYAAILPAPPQGAQAQTQEYAQLAARAFYRWPTAVTQAAATQVKPLNSRVAERHGKKIKEYELGR